ncbi:CMF_collapsed_G0045390.mRNA.1.CDS.1 [Saccharomyces cerevisiae]|nr:CMF_collapsed_G0045390.mRNA.1.CDS.1 [Saccharomyces cerevisiae]
MTPDSPVKSDLTSLGEVYVNSNNDQGVRFSSQIILYDTYGEFEYDRHPEISTCNQLTPQLAQMIKLELNELKSAMEVHDDSRCYTHFY